MRKSVQSMKSVYSLMRIVALLKETNRTGWNKKFPPGHRCKTRKVKNTESSADHTFGCVILALLVAEKIGLDPLKLCSMLAFHDLVEFEAKDWANITETGAKLARLERLRKQAEQRAMRKIAKIGGVSGRMIEKLWREFEANKTPEARIANQLDKLEACFQAVHYRRRGDQLDPMEFVSNGVQLVTDPQLRYLVSRLERDCRRMMK